MKEIEISTHYVGDSEIQTVDARSLHAFLQVGTQFTDWIKRRIEEYSFMQHVDFVTSFLSIDEGGDGRIHYHLSLDMGKELAMVERNLRGKQARRYFIECERRALAQPAQFEIPKTYAEALRLAANQADQIVEQQRLLDQQKPAVEFAHAIRNTEDGVSIGRVAAVLGIGRNRFFAKLRADRILMNDNLPYQEYRERGYFKVIEGVRYDTEGEPHPTFQTLVTGRGQVYLQRKYGAEKAA